MIAEKRLFDILKRERIILVQYNLKFPEISEANSKINEFIYSFSKNYEDFIRKPLFKYALSKYDTDPHPRKHLHFKAFEVFQEYKITYNDGKIISIVFDIILRRDGRVIGYERFSHTFDLKYGLILPPKYLVNRKKAKKVFKSSNLHSYYIENRMVVGYENKFNETHGNQKVRKSDIDKFIKKTQAIPLKH